MKYTIFKTDVATLSLEDCMLSLCYKDLSREAALPYDTECLSCERVAQYLYALVDNVSDRSQYEINRYDQDDFIEWCSFSVSQEEVYSPSWSLAWRMMLALQDLGLIFILDLNDDDGRFSFTELGGELLPAS